MIPLFGAALIVSVGVGGVLAADIATLVISVPCSATMRPVSPAITRSAAWMP